MAQASGAWFSARRIVIRVAVPTPIAIPYALTSSGPGTSTVPFSAMDYLTTIQVFDFGKGSAMEIIFLIMVSFVITLFFKQMRKSLT